MHCFHPVHLLELKAEIAHRVVYREVRHMHFSEMLGDGIQAEWEQVLWGSELLEERGQI